MANITPPGVPADFGNAPFPAGEYDLIVMDTAYQCSKAGHPMIQFEFAVNGPEYNGRRVFYYAVMPSDVSYDHYNLMWGKFNGMMESMGMPLGTTFPVPDMFGSKENQVRVEFFHGKMCRAKVVATDGSDGYDPKNEIKNFCKPTGGAPAGVPYQGNANGNEDLGPAFPSEQSGMDDVPFSNEGR